MRVAGFADLHFCEAQAIRAVRKGIPGVRRCKINPPDQKVRGGLEVGTEFVSVWH